MASISSLNSINGLNLWLDATDLSTISITSGGFDVRQWTDKSSNAYQFTPIRPTDPPKLSTNGTSSVAILFDLVSSFQMISRKKIPATSSLDFFAVLIPYSLWGPRAPLFDSADITVAETDTRFNTQIYADGNEFFRALTAPGYTTFPTSGATGLITGSTIYQGNLFLGNNANTGSTPNYLIQYSRKNHNFELFTVPMLNSYTRALAVYDGKLFTASSTSWEYYTPASNRFISTQSLLTRFSGPLVVYRRNLFSMPVYSWENAFYQNSTTPYPGGFQNALLQFSTGINRFSTTISMSSNFSNQNWNTDVTTTASNFMVYKDSLYINTFNNAYSGQLFRYNGTFFNNAHNLANCRGYLSVYWGSLIFPLNSQTLYKFNDSGASQNFARLTYGMFSGVNGPSGNAVTYKGNYWVQRSGATSNDNNVSMEIFEGERGGYYGNASINPMISGGAMITSNSSNLMIVHDGKIYFCGNSFNWVYEYGNGTSLDQSYSTLTSGPILLQIRKFKEGSEMFLNGRLVETQATNFTFSNQPPRQMWVGGGAGTMNSAQSDCGSDHFQGAIQEIVQYKEILNLENRQKVEGILAWKYGIQNVLPASNPYRNSRP